MPEKARNRKDPNLNGERFVTSCFQKRDDAPVAVAIKARLETYIVGLIRSNDSSVIRSILGDVLIEVNESCKSFIEGKKGN